MSTLQGVGAWARVRSRAWARLLGHKKMTRGSIGMDQGAMKLRLRNYRANRIGQHVNLNHEKEKEQPGQREIARLVSILAHRYGSRRRRLLRKCVTIYSTHLPKVVVALLLERQGDCVQQHVDQHNEEGYHELLDGTGQSETGEADQPELSPQHQQLPPHERWFEVTAPSCARHASVRSKLGGIEWAVRLGSSRRASDRTRKPSADDREVGLLSKMARRDARIKKV